MTKDVAAILTSLKRAGSRKSVEQMGARFGIVTSAQAYGVSVPKLRAIAKALGRDHALAEALWRTRVHDARMLASMVDDPAKVTPAQMDRWVAAIDNWAVCDALCFDLFDKTPHAFAKIAQWAQDDREFVKRAAFALLASVALHDKTAKDADFRRGLKLIEKAADDERNFVKKGVSWALRAIGQRRPALHAQCVALARKLAASENATERWIGKDALKDITRPLVLKRLAALASRDSARD